MGEGIVTCVWCGDILYFGRDRTYPPEKATHRAWRHIRDGATIRVRADGSDDHVALPNRSPKVEGSDG